MVTENSGSHFSFLEMNSDRLRGSRQFTVKQTATRYEKRRLIVKLNKCWKRLYKEIVELFKVQLEKALNNLM